MRAGEGVVPMAWAVLFAPGCQALSVPWVPEGDLPTVWGPRLGGSLDSFPPQVPRPFWTLAPRGRRAFVLGTNHG